MVIKDINIFHFKAFQNIPKLAGFGTKTMPSGNPASVRGGVLFCGTNEKKIFSRV
jgi:hypothetical protein